MKPTLIFDVGHGGRDPGTTAGDIVEKELQLRIALATRDRLLARYEVTIILTRDRDTEVYNPNSPKFDLAAELQARCNIAHQHRAAAMFSFHHNNSGGNPDPRGFEQYVYGPKSWVLSTGQHAPRSFAIAKAMEPILKERMEARGIKYNGIKDGNFHVTRGTNLPVVLFETFYASSPYEAGLAKKDGFVDFVADAYAAAIASAMNLTEKVPMWGDLEALYLQDKKIITDIPADLDKPVTFRWVITVLARIVSRLILKDGRF